MKAFKPQSRQLHLQAGAARMQTGRCARRASNPSSKSEKMKFWRWVLACLAGLACGGVTLLVLMGMGQPPHTSLQTQSDANGRVPTIEEYQPKSTLVTAEHKPGRAKYPFVDIHCHHWNPTAERG